MSALTSQKIKEVVYNRHLDYKMSREQLTENWAKAFEGNPQEFMRGIKDVSITKDIYYVPG